MRKRFFMSHHVGRFYHQKFNQMSNRCASLLCYLTRCITRAEEIELSDTSRAPSSCHKNLQHWPGKAPYITPGTQGLLLNWKIKSPEVNLRPQKWVIRIQHPNREGQVNKGKKRYTFNDSLMHNQLTITGSNAVYYHVNSVTAQVIQY